MEVNIKQALKMFFSKSSFEMIYFEAFANALDAEATEFNIDISVKKLGEWDTLILTLSDNGKGFTDDRFKKFSTLFDVEEQTHKGLGRLVYLCYFSQVDIESVFEPKKKRCFTFNDSFDKDFTDKDCESETTGTKLTMTGFYGEKLAKNEYITAKYIKKALLENFYMKIYKAKLQEQDITVQITTRINDITEKESISSLDMPDFQHKELDDKIDMFNSIDLYYNIKAVEVHETNVITALAIDDRTHKIDIIAKENIQPGYEMIFLLMSESFSGETDGSRQFLQLSETQINEIKKIFREAISSVVEMEVPALKIKRTNKILDLTNKYPHLKGYLDANEIGYSSQSDLLKKAQEAYFRDQKDILGATELNDEQYQKSLDLSARTLTEYILFRENVIKKLQAIKPENKESDIHNILVPQRTVLDQKDFMDDLYYNNLWVLDEKFMSYSKVLSEQQMKDVIDVMTNGEIKDDDIDRPDITVFFSGDPNDTNIKTDVIVIELKRLGIKAEENSIVEFQLDTRAERLAEYYGNRIQRMWFYGVVDFDEKYIKHLINNQYIPLYSAGKLYYKSKMIYTNVATREGVLQHSFILDYSALVHDAKLRNSTFLKILKSKF